MRVFFPYAYYYPEQCAGIYVVDDLMCAFAEAGIESYLSVPTPTRNVAPDAKWFRTENKFDGKVVVHRFRMYAEGKNPIMRALRYLLCECEQLHFLLWKKYDVIFIDSTPPIQGLKLPILKLFRKKTIIFNIHDLFPETLTGTGLAKSGGLLWKIGMWVSNVTFRNSDKIIAISNDIKRSMVARGVPAEKIEVVYNWVDEKAVHPVLKEDNPLFEEFGIDRDKFTIVYAGNLGNAQNISIILQAAKLLKDDDLNDDDNLDNNQMVGSDEKKVNNNFNHNQGIQFVIFGTGGLEEELRRTIEKEHLNNVRLLPLQPYERVSQVYSLGDACIVSCKEGLGGSAMPSKTWTIMSCGRPVIASFDEGELKDIVEGKVDGNLDLDGNLDDNDNQDNNLDLDLGVDENLDFNGNLDVCDNKNVRAKPCGIFTKAGDKEAFKEAILKLYRNPELCKEYGRNGRQFILQNLTKEVGTRKYVEVIKSVAEEKRR